MLHFYYNWAEITVAIFCSWTHLACISACNRLKTTAKQMGLRTKYNPGLA